MQTFQLNTLDAMGHCVLATLIAAVIAVLVNRFLLVVHVDVQIHVFWIVWHRSVRCSFSPETMTPTKNSIRKQTVKNPFHYLFAGRYLNKTEQRHHFNDQLIIRSYLISQRIQDLDKSRPLPQRDPLCRNRKNSTCSSWPNISCTTATLPAQVINLT